MSQVQIIFHLKCIYYEVVTRKVKPLCYTAEHSPEIQWQLLLLLIIIVYNKHLLKVVSLNNMLTTYVIWGFHDGTDSAYFLFLL
jgi:hypothetical protein